ncbi:histidine--tRNA ligase [Clostridia bacterium]|nr:histidine--tRNA ligase [Clostridia bacterium]
MITRPKGTIDILPADAGKWHFVENAARETARLYNLREIRTPNFEHTDLFLRGVGETTDIVNKEMYTFTDKGGRSITLKPEGTAGVARAYVENGLANEPKPLKMYYITPVYRYERPQAGRLREHRQFGVELYGASAPSIDAEAILIARSLLYRLGIKSLALHINSVGCPDCRKVYNEALRAYLKERLPKMCPACNARFEKNPLRILDCKEAACKEITEAAPHITDYLCHDCKEHFSGLQSLLKIYGVAYKVNPYIVRGLDYYNRTVFEFVADSERAQGTVCGGGRYDRLVEEVGGNPEPAVGFGMGIERLLNVMEADGLLKNADEAPDYYLIRVDVPMSKDQIEEIARKAAEELRQQGKSVDFDDLERRVADVNPNELIAKIVYQVAEEVRQQGKSVDFDHLNRSVKAQFKAADRANAKNAVVIGGDEVKLNALTQRNLKTGIESPVEFGYSSLKGLLLKAIL